MDPVSTWGESLIRGGNETQDVNTKATTSATQYVVYVNIKTACQHSAHEPGKTYLTKVEESKML